MVDFGEVTASVRMRRGKGAARSLRRDGKIPAVMYGQGKDNVALVVDPREFNKATDPDKQWNTLYNLTIKEEGKADLVQPCVLVDVQVDTIRSDVKHLDFMRVDPDQEVVRKVPLRFTGRSIGVTKGGKLKTFRRHLRVAAKPTNIPFEVVVDITPIDAGESYRVKDVQIDDVRLVEEPDQRLCFVELPKAKTEDEAEDPKAAAKKK